jgi:hypothetical protein
MHCVVLHCTHFVDGKSSRFLRLIVKLCSSYLTAGTLLEDRHNRMAHGCREGNGPVSRDSQANMVHCGNVRRQLGLKKKEGKDKTSELDSYRCWVRRIILCKLESYTHLSYIASLFICSKTDKMQLTLWPEIACSCRDTPIHMLMFLIISFASRCF